MQGLLRMTTIVSGKLNLFGSLTSLRSRRVEDRTPFNPERCALKP